MARFVWFKHPAYLAAQKSLVTRLRDRPLEYRRPPRLVFLCGGAKSERREAIRSYIKKRIKHTFSFFADDVWLFLSKAGTRNALKMEEELGRLADCILLIVESPGTFAELGAFSLSPELRAKMLVVLDQKYRLDESFINTGPVRWVDAESLFAPCVYSRFDTVLDCAQEIEDRLDRIPKIPQKRVNYELATTDKLLLLFLIDLVSVIGPAPKALIDDYVSKIFEPTPPNNVETLLALATSMKLIAFDSVTGLFTGPPAGVPYYPIRRLDLRVERLRLESVLQKLVGDPRWERAA